LGKEGGTGQGGKNAELGEERVQLDGEGDGFFHVRWGFRGNPQDEIYAGPKTGLMGELDGFPGLVHRKTLAEVLEPVGVGRLDSVSDGMAARFFQKTQELRIHVVNPPLAAEADSQAPPDDFRQGGLGSRGGEEKVVIVKDQFPKAKILNDGFDFVGHVFRAAKAGLTSVDGLDAENAGVGAAPGRDQRGHGGGKGSGMTVAPIGEEGAGRKRDPVEIGHGGAGNELGMFPADRSRGQTPVPAPVERREQFRERVFAFADNQEVNLRDGI